MPRHPGGAESFRVHLTLFIHCRCRETVHVRGVLEDNWSGGDEELYPGYIPWVCTQQTRTIEMDELKVGRSERCSPRPRHRFPLASL